MLPAPQAPLTILLASRCSSLHILHVLPHAVLQAMDFYNDALHNCDTHAKSMMALAKLHLANGNVDGCQQQVGREQLL